MMSGFEVVHTNGSAGATFHRPIGVWNFPKRKLTASFNPTSP
jgi:hypothetical protein